MASDPDSEVYADVIEAAPRFGLTELCSCVVGRPVDQKRTLERMNLPDRLRDETLATWHPNNGKPRLETQTFACTKPWPNERYFLVLAGPPGRGKTHLAVGAMKAILATHGIGGRFVVVPELLRRIRATFDEETRIESAETVFGEMTSCRLLCLDDLGAEKPTEWAAEQVFLIVNHRWAHKLPTIITTNLDDRDVDERIFSRIFDKATSVRVTIDGAKFPDRRLA